MGYGCFLDRQIPFKNYTRRKNSIEQQKKPYVILISVDGFRYDYVKKYKAKHLLALSDSGVRASSMIPSYPSVTFPKPLCYSERSVSFALRAGK